MKISVLMAVYKSEQPDFLDKALNSIWTEQTLKPVQIVLIEDGPLKDELYAVIYRWKDRLRDVLTIHQNEKNLGLTKSLNVGIELCTGECIARMDSDDIAHPLRFEKQVNFLQEHPEVDVLGGSIQEFNETNENLGVRNYPMNTELCKKCIVKGSPMAHPTVMMRRRVFDEGNRYNEIYKNSQDVALWFTLLAKGYQLANLQEVTLYFRRSDAVFQRRKRFKTIYNEFRIYMKGIYSLHGVCRLSYIYPISRFFFRLMPSSVSRFIYNRSSFRNRLLR